MSAVVKTITPFIHLHILLRALDEVGCKYTIQNEEILTDRLDYRGNQKFVLNNGKYSFVRDSHGVAWSRQNSKDIKSEAEFLQILEKAYQNQYEKYVEELAELERIRIEEERKAYVEKQKAEVIKKAKEQGYSIKEEKVKGKIKLVLIKNTYK